MKKIMFNDRFCLTQAVLEGRKTMTRRIIKGKCFWERCPEGMWTSDEIKAWEKECDKRLIDLSQTEEWGKAKEWALSHIANYKIGEVVAVAQSYKDAGYASETIQEGRAVRKSVHSEDWDDSMIGKLGEWNIDQLTGWDNKMFTLPEMMPHQIRITDIKVERLQEISNEDCLKEGIRPYNGSIIPQDTIHYVGSSIDIIPPYGFDDYKSKLFRNYYTPKEAYSELIGRIDGKGTWKRNPWVFVYDFELVK